jgi:hypothetical protein
MDLVRQLNSDDDATRIEEALQADHRLQAKLHPSVVLLHDVVEILAGPDFHWIRTPEVELAIHSHHPQGRMTGFVSIQRDTVRMRVMFQRLANECFRGRLATRSTEIELHSVPLTIDRAIQIRQLATNLNKGFIDTPTTAHWPLEPPPTLFARFGIANHPSQNRRMRDS